MPSTLTGSARAAWPDVVAAIRHERGRLHIRVAGLVREAGDGGHVARYGPDEFLIVRPGCDSAEMEMVIGALRTALEDASVQFGDSEPLPITVSVGVGGFPEHATAVTELLSDWNSTVADPEVEAVRIVGDPGDLLTMELRDLLVRMGMPHGVHPPESDIGQEIIAAYDGPPVFPLVASTMIPPGLRAPEASASSIIEIAIRSLTHESGLKLSSFTSTSAPPAGPIRLIRTSGVLPMVSVMSL